MDLDPVHGVGRARRSRCSTRRATPVAAGGLARLVGGLTAAAIGTVCFALAPGALGGLPRACRTRSAIEGATWIRTVGDVVMLVFVVALLGRDRLDGRPRTGDRGATSGSS